MESEIRVAAKLSTSRRPAVVEERKFSDDCDYDNDPIIYQRQRLQRIYCFAQRRFFSDDYNGLCL